MKNTADNVSFGGASLSLLAIYAVSATPIPLYGIYRSVDGLSYSDLSVSAVVYFLGAVTALVVFGRLSNHLGRRPVALLALSLAALACASLLFVHSALPLILGRLLQGLSCGLASTALASWLIDTAPPYPAWLTPAIISCGPMTGLTIGGLGSGALVDYGPVPRLLPYLVALALLLMCILLVMNGRETVPRKPGTLHSLRPEFSLPPSARRAYPIAACVFVCTWALGGFFQAFGPAMAMEQLHSSSALAAALVFASVMAPSVIGASASGRLSPFGAQCSGMVIFTLAVFGLLLALKSGLLLPFLATATMAGIAQGAALSGSIRSLVEGIELEERAGTLSVIYATSYTGAAIPTLIAGQLSGKLTLVEVATGYFFLAMFGCIVVLLSRLWARPARSQ